MRRSRHHACGAKTSLRPQQIGDIVPGNRNVLFLIIGALAVGLGVVGYSLYQEKKEPQGVEIKIGPDGLKIQNR